ncbi:MULTISPECIES: acyl-CoA dehydrogenase family protein [Spongiibacter]|jgi:3-hydroxy-9,10-secoandrosta-1,3,5(10)-triene-9,17-dione monooxygenase|uniref:acyl-CoA dehydrogenase family protein n=1 Tax=Spongiibacter TaxID=630749 RepID=UPI000C3C1AD3|nr:MULTISPECIES: acyl-CoA dehydrogenase family protein [Spongiibacter]MAY37373.1 flavin-dependent monooxygenase [Spongiibacter sp.]MBO6754152.1 flavin-dependent monooxygenase [Spongiibacter sp.]|tara:strand:- start:3041 stop:4225 length:1185 start_codon:yes stop_codon:yes gene_type:complete
MSAVAASESNATNNFDTMMAAIKELQPVFRERAPQTRKERKVPQASIDALQDIGFFLALQPKRYGGLEMRPQEFFKMQIAIAEACMSTAWASGIIAVHALQLAMMDDRAQQAVWNESIHTRVSSSYAPMGKVTPVEGGFRFSGRWGWSSGSDHCTWVLLGGIIPGEGYRTFLIPKSDYEIVDTWHSMGLEGTGSNDIVVDDVFVPDYMTHKQSDGFAGTNPGLAVNDAPLYRLPWAQSFIRVVSTPAIGACKATVDLYKHAVLNKASGDPTKLAGDTQVVERIAAAQNGIDEMEAILLRNFDVMMDQVERGEAIPLEDRVRYRYQASLVITKSIQIIDSLFEVAGGHSVFNDSEIQQRFRDVHTARAHVANNPTSFARNFGGVSLGMENTDFFI